MKRTTTTTGVISFFGKGFSFADKATFILFISFFFISALGFAAPPTVTTSAASSVTNSGVYLNGAANPNGFATTSWFRYSTTHPGTANDTFGSRRPTSGGTSLGSGTSSVAYSEYLSGLSAGTTYYYCAVSQSAEGISFGDILSFTTCNAPTVVSTAATLVTSNSATINGTANPNGDATYGYFRYSTSNPIIGSDTFGTRLPSSSSSDTNLGAGASLVPFSRLITGLTPGKTYYYCAISRNAYGTKFGEILSFTTPAAPPTTSTNLATSITTTSAILNGSSNSGGAQTTGWFRIATASPGSGNDTFGTRIPSTGGTDLGGGNIFVPYGIAASGLSPGTTYYYCAISQNSEGISYGAIVSFTTPMVPTVNTLAATSVTATTASLNASVNPNGSATTGWFRYSLTDPGTGNDTFGTRLPSSGGQSLGSGTVLVACQRSLTGLIPNTTYYYCIISQSTAGTSFGNVLSFTTPAVPPTVTTNASSSITTTGATLNGTVNANNTSTSATFEYGLTTAYGTTVTADQSPIIGSTSTAVSTAINGLSPNTTYHYRVIGNNSEGTTNGLDATFRTLKLSQTITFNALPTKIYGDPSYTISATSSSGLDVVFTSSDETIATCSGVNGTTITILKAGICNIKANQIGDANFEAALEVAQTLTINKKTITVNAEQKTKIFGDPDPVLTYTFSPALVGSDNFSGALTRIEGECGNCYAQIQIGSLSLSPNYTLVYIPEDLIIYKRTITVKAVAKTKTYGDPDPVFTYTFSPALAYTDNFSGSLTRIAGEGANTAYQIQRGSLSLNPNYNLVYVPEDLTINKKTITVNAEQKTKTFGDPDPVLTYTFSPALSYADNFSGSLTRIAGEGANTAYQIQRGSLSLNPNYNLVYVPEDLTINKKSITVSVNANQTKVYGENDPTFAYITDVALVGNDKFTGALSRVAGETVGTYAIEQGSLALNTNYNLTYVGNVFEITKGTPELTWNNPISITYGTILSDYQLNAAANVAGAIIYTPALGTKLNAGIAQKITANFTPADVTNYNTASKTVTIDVAKATPKITWNNPEDINSETALSSIQLNATSDVVGTFTYTPAIGTKLNVGNAQFLKVDFTPIDAENYEFASKTVFVNVILFTGLSEVMTNKIVVFPNPAMDAFSVFGIEGTATISLTDLNGKIILAKKISDGDKIYLTTLSSGIYIIKIETVNGQVLRRLLKK